MQRLRACILLGCGASLALLTGCGAQGAGPDAATPTPQELTTTVTPTSPASAAPASTTVMGSAKAPSGKVPAEQGSEPKRSAVPGPTQSPSNGGDDVVGYGGGGRPMVRRTLGPYASQSECVSQQQRQPIQASDCYAGSDGNYYFDTVVQGKE